MRFRAHRLNYFRLISTQVAALVYRLEGDCEVVILQVVQCLCKFLDDLIDVVFVTRAVDPAAIQGLARAAAKLVGVLLDLS